MFLDPLNNFARLSLGLLLLQNPNKIDFGIDLLREHLAFGGRRLTTSAWLSFHEIGKALRLQKRFNEVGM